MLNVLFTRSISVARSSVILHPGSRWYVFVSFYSMSRPEAQKSTSFTRIACGLSKGHGAGPYSLATCASEVDPVLASVEATSPNAETSLTR